jgi:hypothetical protein
VALALAAALTGCGIDDQGVEPVDAFALDAYARDVHPIFEARCATLDCHGVAGRPLRLFAETGLRLRADLRDLPITEEELFANVKAVEAIDPGAAPERQMILRKPLAEDAGGVEHEGGELWLSRDAPQAACVLAWLSGRSEDPSARDACAAAADEVALPPP